jgi:hypothetical protein
MSLTSIVNEQVSTCVGWQYAFRWIEGRDSVSPISLRIRRNIFWTKSSSFVTCYKRF